MTKKMYADFLAKIPKDSTLWNTYGPSRRKFRDRILGTPSLRKQYEDGQEKS